MTIGVVSPFNPYELRDFLFDNQSIPNTNIMASSVQALVTGFINLGHDVVLFSPVSLRYTAGKKFVMLEGSHLKIYLISTIPKINFLVNQFYLPNRISRIIQKQLGNLDILHSHWTYECSAATVRFADKIPTFCSVRDWWPVQYDYFKNKGFRSMASWRWGKRRMFEKTMKESKIHFLANSEYTRQQINGMYPDYIVPIIPNPINGNYIIKDRKFRFNGVFISIANSLLEERKNIETLLRAFREYHIIKPNSRLILVGYYSKNDPKYKKWEKLGLLNGVELCGTLPHDVVMKKIDEASVLIHPSFEETFGNILLEGMARRVLIVGGVKSGAVPSVLGYGKYGLLCDVSNDQTLLSLMNEISTNEMKSDKLIESATSYLIDNFTESAVARKHISLFESSIRKVQ